MSLCVWTLFPFAPILTLAYQNNQLQGILFLWLKFGSGGVWLVVFYWHIQSWCNGFSVTDLNLQFPKKFGGPGKKRKLSNNVVIPVPPSFCFLGGGCSILRGYFAGLLWPFLLWWLFSLLITLLWTSPLNAYSFERITSPHALKSSSSFTHSVY